MQFKGVNNKERQLYRRSEVSLKCMRNSAVFHSCGVGLAWGLMAGLQRCASPGALFRLGAGCQKWKPLDIPGTQPPLSDAVVNWALKPIVLDTYLQ